MIEAGKAFFATSGGWTTFLTLIITVCAVLGIGWKLMSKLNRIAETPDKLDEITKRLDIFIGQATNRIDQHEREFHRRDMR